MAYESLFQPKGFFRDYEPVVLNTHLPKIAETLRGRYDEGVAAKSLLDRAIGSVRTIGNDAQAINRAQMDIDSIINNRVDFENMGKTITDATSRFLTDHSVLNAIDSYSARKKEIEENEQLKARGVQILDFNTSPVRDAKGKLVKDPEGKPVLQHRSDAWDSSVDGIYQRASETKLNWEERALQLLQGIASDSGSIRNAAIAAGVDPSQFGKWLSTGEGVTKGKMEKVADALTDPFLKSQEGIQIVRALTQLEINPETGDMYRPEEAREQVREYLKEVGLKQVGWTEKLFPAWEGDSSGSEESGLPQSQLTLHALNENPEMSKVTNSDDLNRLFTDTGTFKENAAVRKEPKLTARIKKLETDILSDRINWNEYSSVDFARFIQTDNEFTRSFPRKSGESDKMYTERLAGVVRKRPTSQELMPTYRPAAAELAELALSRGIIYQENGNPYNSLEDFLEDTDKAFRNESTVQEALNRSIQGEKKGESIDGQPQGVTSLVTTGKHAGKLRHTFFVGDEKMSLLLSPVQGMDAQFNLLKNISEIQSSLNPNRKDVYDMGEHGVLELRNSPSKDGKAIDTRIFDDGTELSLSEVAKTQQDLILYVYRNSGTIFQKAFTFTQAKGERDPK
jgi:hypothetical protein